MTPIELIEAMKQHVARLTTQRGAAGEIEALGSMANWLPRPKGPGLKVLLAALRDSGIVIKKSSFDAIAMPEAQSFDFCDQTAVRSALPDMVFIEIKTANQDRVGVDFSGYFFSLTESEIVASEALGKRHRVALYNKSTRVLFMTSVSELLARAKSATWQFSIQL